MIILFKGIGVRSVLNFEACQLNDRMAARSSALEQRARGTFLSSQQDS
jgi:hypothetical protein